MLLRTTHSRFYAQTCLHAALAVAAMLLLLDTASADGFEAIASPRLAAADLDGDGVAEVIAGGRLGPFAPVTDPPSSRRARVEVYAGAVGLLRPVATTDALNVVRDLAAADLDGDGRSEILVVGHDRLTVLVLSGDRLRIAHTLPLPAPGAYRIDCLVTRQSRRPKAAIAGYRISPDGGVGISCVSLATWTGSGFAVQHEERIRGHVGDLAFVAANGGSPPLLVVELGGGDEGGNAVGYAVGRTGLAEVWRAPLSSSHTTRVLHLTSLPGTDLLASASVEGLLMVHRIGADGLTPITARRPGGALPSLQLVGDPVRPQFVTAFGRLSVGAHPLLVFPALP